MVPSHPAMAAVAPSPTGFTQSNIPSLNPVVCPGRMPGLPSECEPSPEDGTPAAAASSSLVHRKFSVEKVRSDPPEQAFRFKNTPSTRQALLEVLDDLDLSPAQRSRFEQCGSDAWIQREQLSGRLRVSSKTCKLRFCPACRAKLAKVTRKRVDGALRTHKVTAWRFVTLTLRHSKKPLREQLQHLRQSFRRLRQRKQWKAHVQGGIAVIELTRNRKKDTWHPHLHCVVAGTYFPQPKLATEWLIASRTSCIVDIRSVWTIEGATDYLCKYLTKSPLPSFVDDKEALVEYVNDTKRGHMLITFGDVKAPKPAEPDDKPSELWEPMCSLAQAINAAKSGNEFYLRLLRSLTASDEPDAPDQTETEHPP